MKKHFFVLVFFMCIIISYTEAQISKELSVKPLLNEGESRYIELMKNSKGITRFEIDQVNLASNRFTPIKLNSGNTYSILLFGELNIIDEIELKIYSRLNGSKVLKDDIKKLSRTLDATFKPDKTDFYEFEIIANKFSEGNRVGRYCLIIARNL
jgi:hypothetical protein